MSDQSAIDDALDRAISLHSLGQLEEAEALYRGILQAFPAHPDALNLLGVICQQSGRLAEAIELLTLAIKADPQAAEFHYNVGEALRADRQFEQAAVHLKRATELHGKYAPALKSLAEVYMLLKDEHPAIDCYLKAAKLDLGDGRSRFNAAVAYRRLGKVDEAVLNLEEAVDADPLLAEAYQLLSRIYVEQKNDESALASARRLIKNVPTAESYAFLAAILSAANLYDDAIDAAHQSVRLDPDCVEGHYQLGRAFDAIGEKRGAALAFGRAGELKPDAYPPYLKLGLAQLAIGEVDRAAETFAAGTRLSEDAVDCWYNLAVAYERLGKVKQGIEAIEKALEIKPDWPPALVVLAIIESKRGRHSVAAPLFEKALELAPNFGSAWCHAASFYAQRGEPEQAVDALRRAIILRPTDHQAHNVLCFFSNGDTRLTPREIYEEHRKWGANHFDPADMNQPSAFPNNRDPSRRLRIGYVSPDLRAHSVSFFFSTLLRSHNRDEVEVFCYDDSIKPDNITGQLQARSDHWRRTTSLPDEQFIKIVSEDQIDILVDLAGHTSDNRLTAFARRAAPIQVTFLGYPNTTGLASMDYRLTDALADPPGESDSLHSEKLVRLPNTFLCYGSTPDAPAVSDLPADQNGYITFGSFNALTKINQKVIELWTRVVNAVDGSKLLVKGAGLSDSGTIDLFVKRFERAGLNRERLLFSEKTAGYADHMNLYGRMDIALDPFPYNGTTTTCEALWMGVPVVVLEGDAHVSRVGVSIMTNMGMTDWIAKTPEQYVQIAMKKSADLEMLRRTRMQMRDTMNQSPLRDMKSYAKNVEAAYRAMWIDWCQADPK